MYVNFNNKNSYYDLGLKIAARPNIPVPERNVNLIDIDGRNGSLVEDLGTYKDIDISIDFSLVERKNFTDKCRQIKSWLIGNMTDNKLIFSDDSDYFYKVKDVKIDSDIERKLKVVGRFSAVFTCEPFAYCLNNYAITIMNDKVDGYGEGEYGNIPYGSTSISMRFSIFNEGTFKTEPTITMYGTGDLTLYVNDDIIYFKNIDEYIIVDSSMKNAYKDGELLNFKMFGEFPIFRVGENNIKAEGNINKIEIIPNWRCL